MDSSKTEPGSLSHGLPARLRSRADWETAGAASSGSAASSAPLTYEEIMAQIAQYPGPDEPLYVPAEGEQIWLTDLEGYANIYDNDSIKINYAPGFDKSQITRIDVYRNGVKMRFVPTVFDVLTNAQMKTFDGILRENTPRVVTRIMRSMGRSTRRVSGALQGGSRHRPRCAYVLHSTTSSTPRTHTWETYGRHLCPATGRADVDRGDPRTPHQGEGVGLQGCQHKRQLLGERPVLSVVFRLPGVDLTVADWRFTASDEQLSSLLDLAEQAGLDAEVRMQLYVSRAWDDQTGDYSASMRPRDVDSFLDSYFELAAHLARIAEQHGAVLFTPFTEMDSIGRETERVKAFYTRLTSVFSGEFSFEESTHHYLDGWGFSLSGKLSSPFAQLAGQFWDWRDPQAGRWLSSGVAGLRVLSRRTTSGSRC